MSGLSTCEILPVKRLVSPNLLSWQWQLYGDNHTDRRNLLIHAFAVPLFWSGLFSMISMLVSGHFLSALFGLVAAAIALALEGRGHKKEHVPPVPFLSPLDAVVRLFVEQMITFPRFVLSGGFARAWRAAGPTTTA